MSSLKCLFILALLSSAAAFFYELKYPNTEVDRTYVPDEQKSWKTDFPDYSPLLYSASCSDPATCDPDIGTPGFDPQFNDIDDTIDRRRPLSVWFHREKHYKVENGYPMNPQGRTGLRGRGDLPRWGPNFLTVFILERGASPVEFVVIKSDATDNVLPNFPEFFMDYPEEQVNSSLVIQAVRENLKAKYHEGNVEEIIERGLKHRYDYWTGYYASQRNTDNAWIELVVYQFEDPKFEIFGMTDFTEDNNDLGLEWEVFDPKKMKMTFKHILFHSKSSFFGTLKRRLLLKHLGKKSNPFAYAYWLVRLLTSAVGITAGTVGTIMGG